MMDFVKRHWPLFTSICILWLTIGILLIISIRKNAGNFIYAIDDAYIHLSIAKNFSQYGVWGVTKHGFSSSSSSLLWCCLLYLINLLSTPNYLTPLVLNIIISTAFIILIYLLLYNIINQSMYIFIVLLLMIYLTPLPALIFSGMEHVAQTLITIIFFYFSAKNLATENPIPSAYQYLPLILAPLVTLVRYEGIFGIFIVFLLFFLRKRYLYALSIGILGLAPLIFYGVISISHGWFFLPNPIILKANTTLLTNFKTFFYHLIDIFKIYNIQIISLLLISIIIYIYRFLKGNTFWNYGQIMLNFFIFVTIIHLIFAKTGWFFRYEAYLVAFAIYILSALLFDNDIKEKQFVKSNKILADIFRIFILLLIIISVPFFYMRGAISLQIIPQATTNIFEQQYQMGLFLKKFYQGRHIAANDIGAINYVADINCLDLMGLGNLKVAQMLINKYYSQRQMFELAKSANVEIAILYDHWFTPYEGLPPQWIKVAQWKIMDNVVCGGDTVSFYALNPSETKQLLDNLQRFSPELPKTVKMEFFTVETRALPGNN